MDTRLHPRSEAELKVICRIADCNEVTFALADTKSFEINALDISEGGLGVETKHFLPTGLILELDIDGRYLELSGNIKTKAEVRNCYSIKGARRGYRGGFKFLDISDADRKSIAQYVALHERREYPRIKLAD